MEILKRSRQKSKAYEAAKKLTKKRISKMQHDIEYRGGTPESMYNKDKTGTENIRNAIKSKLSKDKDKKTVKKTLKKALKNYKTRLRSTP